MAARLRTTASSAASRPWASGSPRAAPAARTPLEQRFAVAPMMDYTDVHLRQLCRLLSRRTTVWTEMVVDTTLVRGAAAAVPKFLDFPREQHPAVLQLGGSDPAQLAAACRVAASYGYDELNLNCGCPSPKVAGEGCFGAALMEEPRRVADCLSAMADAAGAPVSVKHRIGVDDRDSYDELCRFVETVATRSPTRLFVVHARKAFLSGLSPAQNRSVPPLRHEWVYALARDFPELRFTINGGVVDAHHAAAFLRHVPEGARALEGVMVGRGIANAPWTALADADRALWGEENPAASRRDVLERYAAYAADAHGRFGVKKDGYANPSVRAMFKPLLNLFHGEPRSKAWKQAVDSEMKRSVKLPGTSVADVLDATLHVFEGTDVLDKPPAEAGGPLPSDPTELPPCPAAQLPEAIGAA